MGYLTQLYNALQNNTTIPLGRGDIIHEQTAFLIIVTMTTLYYGCGLKDEAGDSLLIEPDRKSNEYKSSDKMTVSLIDSAEIKNKKR